LQINNDLPSLTSGTIAAWVKRSSSDTYAVIIGGNTNGVALAIDNNYLNIRKRGVSQVTSTLNFNDNNWHFVAVTFDGTNAKFYLDGNSDTQSCSFSFSSVPYTIGQKSPDSASEYFNGNIDELFFFNRKLSDLEIAELYNSGDGLSYPFATSVTIYPSVLSVSTAEETINARVNLTGEALQSTISLKTAIITAVNPVPPTYKIGQKELRTSWDELTSLDPTKRVGHIQNLIPLVSLVPSRYNIGI
jgi:hypothetical protein